MAQFNVICSDDCNVAANCPVKAVGQPKPLDAEKEGVVLQMLSYRDQIHAALEGMKSHNVHGGEISQLLDGGCDGGHSHGHGCDKHELGHHGEVVQVAGRFEHICDPASLASLINDIERTFSKCGEENCHEDLKEAVANARSLLAQLNLVHECTKQMCANISLAKRLTPDRVKESDFDF